MSRKIDCRQLSATERKVLEAARLEPIIVTVKEAGGVEYSCNGAACPAGTVAKLVERGLLRGRKDGLFDSFPQSFVPSEPKPPVRPRRLLLSSQRRSNCLLHKTAKARVMVPLRRGLCPPSRTPKL